MMKRLLLLLCIAAGVGYAQLVHAQVGKPPACNGPLSVTIAGSGTGSPLTFGSASVTTAITCYGGTATVTLVVTGGTAPYTYTFNNVTNGTGVFTGVTAGLGYNYSITDANNCGPITGTLDVTQPTQLTASIGEMDNSGNPNDMIVCPGGSANLTANGSGGTGSYNYAWSPNIGSGAGPHSVTPALTTTYDLTITDANNCVATASKTVTVNPALTASIGETDNSGVANDMIVCPGGSATLDANPSGGTGPYSYVWDNSLAAQEVNTVTPPSTTTYNVTVTDNNGCQAFASKTITVNPTLTASIGETDNSGNPNDMIVCPGGSATLDANPSGGTGPYSYVWDNSLAAQEVNTVTPPSTTTYNVTVTDNNGCQAFASKQITVNPPISASIDETDNSGNANDMIICPGGSASLTASGSGGTGTLSYTWDNGVVSGAGPHTVMPNSTTTYHVTVTDVNGCIATASKEITVNPTIDLTSALVTSSYNGAQVSCAAGQGTSNDGQITVTASGGTGTLMYSKDNGANFQTSNIFNNLTAGTYDIVVKDASGCTVSTQVTITPPPPITAGTCPVVDDLCQINAGSVTVQASGGTGALNVTWTAMANLPFTGTPGGSPAGSMPTPVPATYTGLSGNSTYKFTVTDANGCQLLP